jgi:hypothetical protein
MNTPGLLKLRLFAARHRQILIALLLSVALVATVGAGWAYANAGQTTDTDYRHPQSISGSVGTSAVVTGETPLYERGTRLTDRVVYLQGVTPNLTLEGQVDAPAGADIHQRLLLQYRATRDDRVVWDETRVLAAGGARRLNTTINVSRVRERASRIQGEFGAAATVDLRLKYVVDYETDRYEGTLNSTTPLTFTQRAYIVDGDLAVEKTRTTTVTVTRQQSPDYGLIGLLAGLGLLSAGGAAVLWLRDPLPSPDAEAEAVLRRRYSEWISSGRVPVFSADRRVEMESLADLVNVAIDSNDRVLYDRDQDIYGVLREGGSLFWYGPEQTGLVDASMEWQTDGVPGGSFEDSTTEDFETAFDPASEDTDELFGMEREGADADQEDPFGTEEEGDSDDETLFSNLPDEE